MKRKINNPESLIKLIFLTIAPFIILLGSFALLYSSEQKEKEPGEEKNNVFNLNDYEIGKVTEEGIVYNRYGTELGTIDEDGVIYNVSKIEMGKTEPDGNVFNQIGTKIAVVSNNGDVSNRNGYKVGYVKNISNIKFIGGAARLIFFKGN